MKAWVSRLLGLSDKTPEKSAAPVKTAARAPVPQPASQPEPEAAWQPPADIDRRFLRCLLGADPAQNQAAANEKAILEGLERLSRSQQASADLIPRVPAVIPQLLQSMHNENISSAELSNNIARDVSLVAEVIRQANSSYYKPRQPITSIENAVMVLGKNGLRMLIAKAAFRPVIHVQSGRYAKTASPRLWEQSEKCAHACRLLALERRIDPFNAFLAGLMQNVGMIVAFRLIDQLPDGGMATVSDDFCGAVNAHARILSHQIALQWNLPGSVLAILSELRDAVAAPPNSPEGAVVFLADRLSKLRLLIDETGLSESDETLMAAMPESVLQCFQQLNVSAEH